MAFRLIPARLVGRSTLLLLCATPALASAAQYNYVDWTEADVARGTAAGTITLPDQSTVGVTFAAINADGSQGSLYGAQVDGGTNYWSPDAPYISVEVENPPPTPDILQLSGGLDQTYVVTLSEPIKDPIMAIVSLGQDALPTTYNFDSPFEIVSQGPGYWGGTDTSLTQLPDNILQGTEGHGTIRFLGTFSTFSWTVPTPESWHGFTFAIRTTERLEPTPIGDGGAGGAGGSGPQPSTGGTVATEGGNANAGSAGESDGGAIAEPPGGAAGAGGETNNAGAPSTGEGGRVASSGGRSMGGSGGESAGDSAVETPIRIKSDNGCGCSLPGTNAGSEVASWLGVALTFGVLGRRRRRARG